MSEIILIYVAFAIPVIISIAQLVSTVLAHRERMQIIESLNQDTWIYETTTTETPCSDAAIDAEVTT